MPANFSHDLPAVPSQMGTGRRHQDRSDVDVECDAGSSIYQQRRTPHEGILVAKPHPPRVDYSVPTEVPLAVWCNGCSTVVYETSDSGSNPDTAAIPSVQRNTT